MSNNFDDILIDIFHTKSETTTLDEAIQMPSLIALTAFKKKALDKVKKPAKEQKKGKNGKAAAVKAGGKEFQEKLRASTGKTTGEDVYKLQKEQKEFLADLYNEYGKELVKDIMDFRKEILSPYNLIKRKVKESQAVTGKESIGLSKKEWERAKESGKNKIESRGKYSDRLKEELKTIEHLENYLKNLFELKRMLSKKSLSSDEVMKINKKMDTLVRRYPELLSKAKFPEGVSAEKVRSYMKDIDTQFNQAYGKLKGDNADIEGATESFKNYINKLTGRYDSDEYDPAVANAIDAYLFQENIRRKLTQAGSNTFKNMYDRMLSDMIEERRKSIKYHNDRVDKMKENVRLTDNEKKVWGKVKGAPDLSSDIDNFYLKIKEKDFEGKSEKIEEPEKVKEARKNIEKAINDFDESLKKTLSSEDYKKLKQYRLLDTIKMKELESPKELFKSKEEVEKTFSSSKGEDKDET